MLFLFFPIFFLLVLGGKLASGQQVCYNPYGCFSKDAPFNKKWMSLPQSPENVGTEFHLFTRPMRAKGHLLNPLQISSIHQSDFDGSKKTVFMSHGFTGSINAPMNKPMTEALLKGDDMNVIVVAWEKGSYASYKQAAANCRLVGAQIAYLVELLYNETGLDFTNVHLIGFSLGSHVVGYAGKRLQANGHKLARITGLDPAAPLFEGEAIGVRLDKSDATFVDVIHTNTLKVAIVSGIGMKKEIGHLDFYVNGGGSQPGCLDLADGVSKMLSCSHQRSFAYFTESINSSKNHKAFPCKTYSDFNYGRCSSCSEFGCPVFGYESVNYKGPSPGKLFLKTTGKSPYLVDHYKITFKTGTAMFGDLIGGFISVTLKGNKGTSEEVHFGRRTMYLGRLQSFAMWTDKDIGEITELIVRHAEPFQKWRLRKVIVQKFDNDQEYMACVDLWIGSTSRVIKLTTNVDKVC